jgi:hypothetical protein
MALPKDVELIMDANVFTVSVAVACRLLGIAITTAHYHYNETGHIASGIPVIRVGKRVLVPTIALRAALHIPEPKAGH